MARGKYSPTVKAAYAGDQEWFTKYRDQNSLYDPDGFDSYGYNAADMDRAGYHENDYLSSDAPDFSDEDYNWAYDNTFDAWGFDGVKPVRN